MLCHNICSVWKQVTSLTRMTLLQWTLHPVPSKAILSHVSFFSSLLCFLRLVNRYLLSTCQVSGLVGNWNKTRKKTDESLPSRSRHSSEGLWCSVMSAMTGKTGVLRSTWEDFLPRSGESGEGMSKLRPEDKWGLAIWRMRRSALLKRNSMCKGVGENTGVNGD